MDGRPGKAEVLISLAMTLLVVWLSMPPQERQWARLAMAESTRRLSGSLARLARRQGHDGMGHEIETGRRSWRYAAAFCASVYRDALAELTEVVKPQ